MVLITTLLLAFQVAAAVESAPAKPGTPAAVETWEPGLAGEYFQLTDPLSEMPEILKDRKPDFQRVDRQINFASTQGAWSGTSLEDNFYVRWNGRIRIPKSGAYTFFLNSDDGSRLLIDGKQVVLNDGTHDMIEIPGNVELSAGDHVLLLEYFESEIDSGCILSWQGPELRKQIVPPEVLFHRITPATATPASGSSKQ